MPVLSNAVENTMNWIMCLARYCVQGSAWGPCGNVEWLISGPAFVKLCSPPLGNALSTLTASLLH